MAKVKPTDDRYSVAEIAEDIKNKIRNQEFAANERLTETSLCKFYQVSRTPIREAFRLLENEGFLVYTLNSGVRVASISAEDSIKSIEISQMLHCIAVRDAADHITEEDIRQLREINKQLLNAASGPERNRLDHEFHALIVERSGNHPLSEHYKLQTKNDMLFETILPIRDARAPHTYEEHENIIKALEEGDRNLAVEYTRLHYLKAVRSIQSKVQEYLEHQPGKKKKTRS